MWFHKSCRSILGSIVLAAIALLPGVVMADNIRWLSTDYDFGTWKEIEGPRTGTVRFINEGNEPTSIIRVRPSCGCTGSDFFKELVMPGDTAWVSFTYNPEGRPGQFEKTVKVYTGEDSRLTTITIRGTIIGRPESLDTRYPVVAGALRLATDTDDLGSLESGKARHSFIQAYNQSTDTIHPVVIDVPESLTIAPSSSAIAPGDFFSFGIFYDSRREHQPGPASHTVRFRAEANDAESEIPVTIKAHITPRRSAAQDANGKSPRLNVSPSVAELSPATDEAGFSFTLKNTGENNLEIKRVYSLSDAITITRYPVNLKPGKSGKLEGKVNCSKLDGEAYGIPLRIITNSPLQPETEVRVAGKIKR